MLVHLYFSTFAFERLVKLRILAEFRPVDEPVVRQGQPCYLDGLEIDRIDLANSSHSFRFTLNRDTAGRIEPTERAIDVAPILARIGARVLLSPVTAVKAAGVLGADGRYGLPDRPPELNVGLIGADLDMFFTVGPDGVPILNIPLRNAPGAELLAGTPTFLDALPNLALPFPVAAAFSEVLPAGARVVNAGIAIMNDGVVIRLEFEDDATFSASADNRRLASWREFFDGRQPSQLAGKDWAIELPTGTLTANAARELDDQLSGPGAGRYFTSSQDAWGVFGRHGPSFDFTKNGILERACAGLDILAELTARVILAVPAPNTLRLNVFLNLSLDEWDSIKCTVLSVLNPLAGIITTFDQGLPWFMAPAVGALLPLVPTALALGGDALAIQVAVQEAQRAAAEKPDGPRVVRTGPDTFYVDIAKSISTPVTGDYLVIEGVGAVGDRLVLRGAYTAPDVRTLPRLRGELTDGFDEWGKSDPCSTVRSYVAQATLTLSLEDVDGRPVIRPIVPIRYGINVETIDGTPTIVGQTTWRIIDDPQNVYNGRDALVRWGLGTPGVFDFQIRDPAEPFASQPYPLRFQLFTSFGVREFEIPAPAPVPPPLTGAAHIAEQAERIANCYIFTSLIHRVKAFQVFWLPRPPGGQFVPAQHWQVLARGFGPVDRLRVWDARTHEPLAEVSPFNGGLVEISLVLPAVRAVTALQLTPNDEPPLTMEEYARRVGQLERGTAVGPHTILVRQTPLYPVAEIELGQPADTLVPRLGPGGLSLHASGPAGAQRFDLDPGDFGRRPVRTVWDDEPPVLAPLPERHMRLERTPWAKKAVTELLEPDLGGQERTVALYYARPWYDGGGVAGRFYAQLDETGRSATVYLRGPVRRALPHLPAPPAPSAPAPSAPAPSTPAPSQPAPSAPPPAPPDEPVGPAPRPIPPVEPGSRPVLPEELPVRTAPPPRRGDPK